MISTCSTCSLYQTNPSRPTPEFKKKLVKICHKNAEDARVAIRNIRRDLIDFIKKQGLPKDEDFAEQQKAQTLHDGFIKQIDTALKAKEKELS